MSTRQWHTLYIDVRQISSGPFCYLFANVRRNVNFDVSLINFGEEDNQRVKQCHEIPHKGFSHPAFRASPAVKAYKYLLYRGRKRRIMYTQQTDTAFQNNEGLFINCLYQKRMAYIVLQTQGEYSVCSVITGTVKAYYIIFSAVKMKD